MTATSSRLLLRAAIGMALVTGLFAAAPSTARAVDTANLLQYRNENAEVVEANATSPDLDVAFWDDRDGATTHQYGENRFYPSSTSPGPPNRGSRFFYGGAYGDSESVQEIDIDQYVTKIKTGTVKVFVSAWLGGIGDQNDRCDVEVRLVNFDDTDVLKSVKLVGPDATDRGNQTKLVKRSKTVLVPKGTRFMGVSILCDEAFSTGSNDGLADSLVIKFLNV